VPFVKPEIVKGEVVPPVVNQLVPLFIEYSYPVIVAPLLVGAVNSTLKFVGPDVTEVIVGEAGCNAYRTTTIPGLPFPPENAHTLSL
jgi:hypothetical protein